MVLSLTDVADARVNSTLDVGRALFSKLQSFHSTMNRLRKEKAVFVAMVAGEGETAHRRKFLSDCYSFVLCTFLVKRRGLDPRQASALLLKRSSRLCELAEDVILYCEKWKDLVYPDESALAPPPSLVHPGEAAAAASSPASVGEPAPAVSAPAVSTPATVPIVTVEEESKPNKARSPRADSGGQRRPTLRQSGHAGLEDSDVHPDVAKKSISISASPRQARVSMNEFVGSAPAGGASVVSSDNSHNSLKGSDERKSVSLKESGERALRGSGDLSLDKSDKEANALSVSVDEVPAGTSTMANAQPAMRSSAPARSLSVSMPEGTVPKSVDPSPKDALRVKEDKRNISTSGSVPAAQERTSPRGGGDLSGSGSLRKTPVRVTSGNFLSRLGAKLVGKKGPKTEIPSTEDEESSTQSGSLPQARKDEPHRAPSPQPDTSPAKERRKERLPDEQDKRIDSSGPSKKREIVDVVSLSDLGSDDQKLISEAALDLKDCEEHLFILLNVLHFHTKKVYRLRDVKTGDMRITSSDREDDTFDYAKAEIELLSREDPSKTYKLGAEVGKGGFGSVFECIPLKNKKQLLACKVLPHSRSKDKKYNLQEVI